VRNNLHRFHAFCLERENIRLRREAGKEWPWTKDEILRTFSFCNVNREHDRVTKWIAEHIRKPYAKHPLLWFNLVVARLFNWPETLKEIGFIEKYISREVREACNEAMRKSPDGKVFTGAYIVSTNGLKMDKVKYVTERVLGPMWLARYKSPENPLIAGVNNNCADWARWFMQFNGMGNFMANQIVTDMKYTPILIGAVDRSTFVLAGPGTKRGLNRLIDRPLKQGWQRGGAELLLVQVRSELSIFRSPIIKHFEDLNNLSNCFCEWDKYERVRLGQGRPRAHYKPHS